MGTKKDLIKTDTIHIDKAGNMEFKVHKQLDEFLSPINYMRQGNEVECRELFSCGYQTAVTSLKDICSPHAIQIPTSTTDERSGVVYL